MTTREPTWLVQFVRRHAGQIVIGGILVGMVSGAMVVLMPYLLEQRIARKIESIGGKVLYKDLGPNWNSKNVRFRMPFWDRVYCIYNLRGRTLPVDFISEIGSLESLERLDLSHTRVTDTHIEKLTGSASLQWLNLGKTRITDSGLRYLTRLKSLRQLYLRETDTSDVGLEHLSELIELNELYLSKTNVTDKGLEDLKPLTHLRVLYVDSTRVTAEGEAMLRATRPKCELRSPFGI